MGVGLLIAGVAGLASGPAFAAGGAPQPGCPSRSERLDLLDEGEAALVEADFGTAETKLRALEGAFGCGPVVEIDLLARMWLLEGAWLTLQGSASQGADSFRAAARVSSAVWVSDYGPKLREAYEAAVAAPVAGSTTLSVEPELFRWTGAVDGQPAHFPTSVSPGLHLVQVGPGTEDTRFSRIVVAFANTPVVVVTGLVEPTGSGVPAPQPAPGTPPPKPPVEHPPLSLHAAAGASTSLGPDPDGEETGTKLALPIETGVIWQPTNPIFTRLAVVGGPLLTGRFAWNDGDVPAGSPSLLGVNLAGGFASRQGDMGALVGWQWPGRAVVRGILAGHVPKVPLRIEGRIGLNLPVGAVPETALDVLVAFTPRLVRHRREPEAPEG